MKKKIFTPLSANYDIKILRTLLKKGRKPNAQNFLKVGPHPQTKLCDCLEKQIEDFVMRQSRTNFKAVYNTWFSFLLRKSRGSINRLITINITSKLEIEAQNDWIHSNFLTTLRIPHDLWSVKLNVPKRKKSRMNNWRIQLIYRLYCNNFHIISIKFIFCMNFSEYNELNSLCSNYSDE